GPDDDGLVGVGQVAAAGELPQVEPLEQRLVDVDRQRAGRAVEEDRVVVPLADLRPAAELGRAALVVPVAGVVDGDGPLGAAVDGAPRGRVVVGIEEDGEVVAGREGAAAGAGGDAHLAAGLDEVRLDDVGVPQAVVEGGVGRRAARLGEAVRGAGAAAAGV